MNLKAILVSALAGAVLATSAHADILRYTLTGDAYATFTVDSHATPYVYEDAPPYVENFDVGPVSGKTFVGPNLSQVTFDLRYYQQFNYGGMDIVTGAYESDGTFDPDGNFGVFTNGQQLYSGTVEDPTLLTGEFSLVEFNGPGKYHLSVVDITSAAPEPGVWALMMAGVGLAGAALRRRRTGAPAAA